MLLWAIFEYDARSTTRFPHMLAKMAASHICCSDYSNLSSASLRKWMAYNIEKPLGSNFWRKGAKKASFGNSSQ